MVYRGTRAPSKGDKECDTPIPDNLRWLTDGQKRKGLVFHEASALPLDYQTL